jgi:hypothetical protein
LGVVITALLFAPTIRRHLQLRRYRLMNATQVHHAIERQRVRIRELEAVLRLPEPRYDEAELTSERRACEQELEELKISLPLPGRALRAPRKTYLPKSSLMTIRPVSIPGSRVLFNPKRKRAGPELGAARACQ